MTDAKSGAGFSLKDQLFNRERVRFLATRFRGVEPDFDEPGFVRDTMRRLKKLELKERIVHIAEQLEKHLSPEYPVAARQISAALPAPLDPKKTDNDFGDFIFAPLGEYVVRNGLDKNHFKLSLRTLRAITKRFSMEDAIRAFINAYPVQTLAELDKWSTDNHYHVRRLVSEGTRPMLPWSARLSIDIETPLGMLDTLHSDRTRYVTRSVANHLNDISKSNPGLVVRTLRRWKREGRQTESELRWMSKHALRTLIKQGHPEAMGFLGFAVDPRIEIDQFVMHTRRINPGQAIEFEFQVTGMRDEMLVIDYVIEFVKANGRRSPKVYKVKQVNLAKGQSLALRKRHLLRADATTYKLYPGTHRVTLQINGKDFGTRSFELR